MSVDAAPILLLSMPQMADPNFAKTVVPYWTKILDLYSELGNSALKK